jgi:hypothetical protein
MEVRTYRYPWLAKAFKAGQGERLSPGDAGSKSCFLDASFVALDIW